MNEIGQKTSESYKILLFWKFSGVRKRQNSSSGGGSDEKIFIYKVPFNLYSLVELIHNSTNAKKTQKIGQVNGLKKERQS